MPDLPLTPVKRRNHDQATQYLMPCTPASACFGAKKGCLSVDNGVYFDENAEESIC